ncbi:hypothetical protein BTA30_03435 [Bacillus swezeyi]|uniref:Uncharacterized protein n=1 Tax=Bacillus swezeyi TaxID=1925020 RepID=A0A1R1QWJ9_9BACI|nr:hypothetical protein BW143_03055 [Bacillus swezeyi]OMI31985.1 hypothetical protein BTA30_03435 [Bacillus swezeyi]
MVYRAFLVKKAAPCSLIGRGTVFVLFEPSQFFKDIDLYDGWLFMRMQYDIIFQNGVGIEFGRVYSLHLLCAFQ